MIKKYSELENIGRGRPVETISFDPPISGPSGAKLISYKWQYKWELAEDDQEGTIERRVSDWDNPSLNDETGRLIVHEFVVKFPDGTTKAVSAETVPIVLGLVTKEEKTFVKNVGNTSKSLARLLVEKAKMDAAEEKYKQALAEIKQLSPPTHVSVVFEPDFKRTEFALPGIKFYEYQKVDKRIPDEPEAPQEFPLSFFSKDIQTKAYNFWKDAKLKEKGVVPVSDYSKYQLSNKIQKMQKKLELMTK